MVKPAIQSASEKADCYGLISRKDEHPRVDLNRRMPNLSIFELLQSERANNCGVMSLSLMQTRPFKEVSALNCKSRAVILTSRRRRRLTFDRPLSGSIVVQIGSTSKTGREGR